MQEQTHSGTQAYPETEKFRQWYESERANGLIDIKFYAHGVEGSTATVETFFAEVNRAIAAEETSDHELL